jgi:hypothetical protein
MIVAPDNHKPLIRAIPLERLSDAAAKILSISVFSVEKPVTVSRLRAIFRTLFAANHLEA